MDNWSKLVCYCGQRSSLLWTLALRPCSGPRERRGNGRCMLVYA